MAEEGQRPDPGWGQPPEAGRQADPAQGTQSGPGDWAAPSGSGQPPGQPPHQPPGWGSPAQPPPPDQPPPWGQPSGWGPTPWDQAPQWGQQPNGWGAPPAWAAARPKPGIIPLRPISLGEIYDGAFQAIRSNPRTMIGLSALVLAVVTVISTLPQAVLLTSLSSNPLFEPNANPTGADVANYSGTVLGAVGIAALIRALATLVVTAMLVIAVSNAVLGRRMAPAQLWARVRHRLLAIIGLSLLTTLVLVLVIAGLALPGTLLLLAGFTPAGATLLVLGLLGGVVLALFVGTRWLLGAPVLLLEEAGVVAALGRSWRLVRGSSWRVFGIQLLTQILVGIGGTIIGFPFGVLAAVIEATAAHPLAGFTRNLIQLVITGVGTTIAGAIFYPFAAAVTTLLYVDLRMRREGLDVELIRASGGPQQ